MVGHDACTCPPHLQVAGLVMTSGHDPEREACVQNDGPCKACQAGRHERFAAVGKPVVKATAFAPGYERTRFEFGQCEVCGSLWMTYTESGPGRDDKVRICLTRGWI